MENVRKPRLVKHCSLHIERMDFESRKVPRIIYLVIEDYAFPSIYEIEIHCIISLFLQPICNYE